VLLANGAPDLFSGGALVSRWSNLFFSFGLAFATAACGPTTGGRGGTGDPNGNGNDASFTGDDGGDPNDPGSDGGDNNNGGIDGGVFGCMNPNDQQGCGCDTPGATRACYTGPAGTDGKGTCKDGTQTCVSGGEFSTWGPCTGDVVPTAENCNDQLDHNCNGKTGCDDAMCVGLPGCCMDGDTRSCYDGPNGTDGVGQCKDGMQVCKNSAWGPCMGEVVPGQELGHCTDKIDNDCNGQIDCKDWACLLDPACRPMVCNPNATQSCYDGPNGTEGVGPCKGGMQTCKQDGSGWGPCVGEVVPGMEGGHCDDMIDNDCNGLTDCKDPVCATAPNCCVMDNNPADGTIYANSADTLYKVDPNNLTVTMIGPFNNGDQMTDIAVTPQGQLYGISFTDLYSVDKNTGKAAHIAAVPGMANNSLTFLPNGTLLAADGNGDVKIIDPQNGNVMAVGNYGNGLVASGDVVAVRDGTMYGVSSTTKGGGDASANNILLRVDTGNGTATPVGPIGFGVVWGLAYSNAKVIAFTDEGNILQIDPQTGAGKLVVNKGILFWGAGQSPLVDDNKCN
jgi:hypothetical protein